MDAPLVAECAGRPGDGICDIGGRALGAAAGHHRDGQVAQRHRRRIAQGPVPAARVDAIGSGEDLHQRPEVVGLAAQRAGGEVAEGITLGIGELARAGNEPTGGFVAEHTVEVGRHADAAADIGAQAER